MPAQAPVTAAGLRRGIRGHDLSGRTVVVKYATAAGTAAAGADFTARAGTLIFPPGTSNQTVAIAIHQDSAVEPDETFVLNLISAVNATLGLSTASCTITDSAAAPLPAGGAGLMVEAVRVGGRSALRMRFPTVSTVQ